MPKKQCKAALKRREEKRHRKAVIRREQVRRASHCARSVRSPARFINVHGMPRKLSEVILDYAAPLIGDGKAEWHEKGAITLSICCWNAALLPLDEAREQIDPLLDILANGDLSLKNDMRGVFSMMYERKQLHYADDKRFIIDYDLTDNDEGFCLQVASAPMAV